MCCHEYNQSDLLWRGEYYLHDFQWRSGLSCQIIGAISLLSSEVSVMMMTLISADRLKNIVFPYQGASLKPKATHILCIIIWVIGFLMAFLPMFGIQYFEDPFVDVISLKCEASESVQFSTCYDPIHRFQRVKAKSSFFSKIKIHLRKKIHSLSCLTRVYLCAKIETI